MVAAGLATIPPLLLRSLIDSAIPEHNAGKVGWLALCMILLAFTSVGLALLNRWFGSVIGANIIYDLRVLLHEHVQAMPLEFFIRTQTGALVARVASDVMTAQNLVSTLATVLSNIFTLVATLIPMFLLSPLITSLVLALLPPFILTDRLLAARVSRLTRHQMQLNAEMTVMMTERFSVSGALLVKLYGRRAMESKLFSSRAGAVRDAGIRLALITRYLFAGLSLVGAVATAAVYWMGGREALIHHLAVGTVVALAAYVTRLYSPLTDLANARVDALGAMVSFNRVFEVLDAPTTLGDRKNSAVLADVVGRIEAKGVWFRYGAAPEVSVASLEGSAETIAISHSLAIQPWVLRDVAFVAEPGTMTALVGPSGAGKTTIAGLIPRLFDVVKGSVTIDNHDVRAVTLASLSAAVGLVTQDAHLFHDTISMNLRYAQPKATDGQLVAACKAACVHDLVVSLADGYDTVVGERGHRLSGGERQRLAIARVLLKDPAVVILDEATAHLDSETELLVQQALSFALAGRTSLVIAHRLSTVQAADQILVIDNGEVVGRGTHSELIVQGGLYAHLYRTQYRQT